MDNTKVASEQAKRWLTNPTEAPPEVSQNSVMAGQVDQGQNVVGTYRTPFAEYHQVMNAKDDAGYTWVQKSEIQPANAPEDVQWLTQARQKYSDSYLGYLNNQISYEKFVLDNFEDDIWRMQGFDFSNPAFWYKRYMQNDFSDPRSNTALRFDILSKSMQYAQQMDFEDVLFSTTSSTNSLLNSLDGKVEDIAGRPVTSQTMETLLGEEWQSIKNIFDGDVDRAIKYVRSSGAEVQRLFYNDADGQPAWYLHTDGKLYKVKPYDGTRQDGYASYKGTAENPTEIWIDSNNLFGLGWSAGDAFASSFGGFAFTVAQTFAQVPMLAIDTIEGLATGDWTFDKVADTALFFQDMQESNMVTARGRIDLDGFQYGSMADWGDAVGGFVGTMAGMIVTAKFGGFLAKSKVAPVKQIGSVLNKMTNIYSGGGFKAGGAGQVAQTASFATDSFMKALGARTTFAVTFALKDGFNTLAQRTLVNDEQAFQKAALVTAVNSAITLALGSTKADDTAYMYKRMFNLSSRAITDPASKEAARRLLGRSIFTATADVFDNYLTMSLAASSSTKGTFEIDWDPSRAIYATLMARNAFVGSQKAGQFISNRIPATVIRDLQADAQARIQNAKTPADIQAAREFDVALKTEINTRLQGAEAEDLATGKAYWDVLEVLSDKLDGDNRAPIKEMVQRIHELEKHSFFKEMMDEGEKLYGELINAEQNFIQRFFLYGFRNTDGTGSGAFNKEFTTNVYKVLSEQTRMNMNAMGDMRSVDDVAKAIYSMYNEREGFSQEDFNEASKNLDVRYENGKVVIALKGVGTAAQGDATWSRTQAILKFAEKYGVLGRFDENDETQFILRATMLKDLDDGLDSDPDKNKSEVNRKKNIKQEIVTNEEKQSMVKQELSAQSMKTLMDSMQRLRNTIEMTLVLARKETINKKDIDMLRNAMGRPDASVEEILMDLNLNGFIKGPVLMELIGKLGPRTIRKSSYMSRARTVYELINQARENPAKFEENFRTINKMIEKGDNDFKKLLNDLYGEDFAKTYREKLSEIFSQQAASDIQGEIKKSYEQAQQKFINDRPIRVSFFKEDGSTKSLSQVASELEIYNYDSNLYKGLLNLYKGGSFNKEDMPKLYNVLISNRDELPRRTILMAAQGQIEKIFRDGVTYVDEDRVQINLAQLITRTNQEIVEAIAANDTMDDDSIISMIAGRRGISVIELTRELNQELEALTLLRKQYPNQSLVEITDIGNELGPLGYTEAIFDKYFAGITALRAGEVLVEIKDATFKPATTTKELYQIPDKSNKQSALLGAYGGARQINETSTIVDGSTDYFVGSITEDKSLQAQTIDNIKSETKGQTFGGKGGANINRTYTILGRELEQQTGVIKYVFLKNIVEEMTNGDYAKGLTTYVRAGGDVNQKELSKQEIKSEFIKRFPEGKELLSDKLLDQVINLIDQEQKGVIPSGSSFRALSSTQEFEKYVFEEFLKENNIPLKTTETISEDGRTETKVNAVKQLADFLTGSTTKPTGDISRLDAEQIFGYILDEVIRTQNDPSIQNKNLTGILNRVTQSELFIVQIQNEWDRKNSDAIVDSVNAGKKQPTYSDFKTMIDAAGEEGKEFLLGAELTGVIPDVDPTLALDFYNYYKDNRRAFLNTFRNNKTNVDILNNYKKDVTPATTRTVERDVTQNDFRSNQQWTNYRNNFNDEVRNFIRQNKSLAEKNVSVTTTGDASRYEKYWNVEKIEDGRLRLTGFKGVEDVTQLDPSEIKYIIPLQLREESIEEFRSLGNDSTMNMKFLNEFEYGTFDREMIVTSGPDNLSIHKLIASYMEFADADQKRIMTDTLLQTYINNETGEQTYGLVDSKVPLQFVGRNANGTIQKSTIVERNIYKLARMESSIQNDADRILVEVAKHFVEMSKDSVGEAERLATDPLFRKVLDEDQTNDPDVIQAEYERQLELARGRNQIDIEDSDFERFAGAFTGLIIEQEFTDLPGAIREILSTIKNEEYTTRIVYEQSPEDTFLEANVVTMNGKKYLPVKSLMNAPEKVFDQIKGGEKAQEKFETIKDLVGERRSTAVRTDMKSRDFPSQINNRAGFRYDVNDSDMFDRIMQNTIRDANLRALQNANLDDTKPKSPLEFEKRAVDLIDRNDFYNESRNKIDMNNKQMDVLEQVFDHFNDPKHPNFVVVLKDGTIFDANNMEYGAQANSKDNSLVFEYLTRRSENPEAFDGAVIFTADNYRKNYYTNVKISGAKFDSKVMDLLSEDTKFSFGKYLLNNKENLDLLDFEKVNKSPKLQKQLEYEQAAWLAQRAAQTVRLRFWFDNKLDIKDQDMRDELFRIIDENVFDRNKTVDNLNKLFMDDQINPNDKGIKSVTGFLTDGVPVDKSTTFKANEIVNTMIEEARTNKWITNEMGDEIVTPEIFDIAYNIIDKKTKTLLTEFNTETLTQRTVPSAPTLNINEMVKQISNTRAYKDLVSFKYESSDKQIKLLAAQLENRFTKKEFTAAKKELTNEIKAEVKNDIKDFVTNRLQDLVALSVLKNSIDDANNVINSNALRIATRKAYGFTQARKDSTEGVQLKQQEDELIREFKNAKKLYTDSEYYEVDGVRKYVSIAFVSDDGLEERFFFRTVSGNNKQEELINLKAELTKTNLPKDVRDGIMKDYSDGFGSNRRYSNIDEARNEIQSVVNKFNISNKGMLLAHSGRSAEFKDYVKFLGLNLDDIRLEDTAEFAAMFRKIGPDDVVSNSLDILRDEYLINATEKGIKHTALFDTIITKQVVNQIIKDFDGYSKNRFEGGRMYSDLEKVLNAFENNKDIKFDRDAIFKETENLLNEIKGLDIELQQDRGPIATTNTFVQTMNLIRELSIQRVSRSQELSYARSLEAYNISDIKEDTRNALNNLNVQERKDFRNLLNILASKQNDSLFTSKDFNKQLGSKLRYDYEVRENINLSTEEILKRLTHIPFALDKLGFTKEDLDKADGDIVAPFFQADKLRFLQTELQQENQLQSTFERGLDFITKGLNVTNKDDLRNLIMAPIFDMFAKDLSQGETFQLKPLGLVDVPRNKKFITQMKSLLNDYSEKALNGIEFKRDVADGTTQGPFKNIVAHKTEYKLTGESEYKTFKANEAFISRTMLDVMLEKIPENLRFNYINQDNIGEYIWSKIYVYPNDNPGKVMAIKMYIHNMDKSTNVELDQTLMKMLARDNDGDKIGFVPVSNKDKELIEGYEFASKAQFGALNELKDVINELKEFVSIDRQKLSIEENVVLQYIRGQEADLDFKNKKATVDFYKNADLAKELREWHTKIEAMSPKEIEREIATGTSLLNKLSKDVQLAGEMRKGSIERHKAKFFKNMPNIKEQLADPDLLAKSIQLPILLDDSAADVIAFAELYPTPEVNRIKQKYNIKSLYELPELFNNRIVEFARNQDNNLEYKQLLSNVIESRQNKLSNDLDRLDEVYSKYIGPTENAYISKGGDYNERIDELEILYNEMDKIRNVQNNIDPEAPLAFKSSRVKVFVSSDIPADARFTNANYTFDERFAAIRDQFLLKDSDKVSFNYEPNKEVAINRGQALYTKDGEVVRSNIDGYARVYVKDGVVEGIITYQANSIGAETKISALNSAIGKTIGIGLSEATKPDGTVDEEIAHFLSMNTFKQKKVADLATIQGFKFVEGSDGNLVSRTINGKEYLGVVLEMDTATLEDTTLWANSNERRVDRSGILNNVDSIFGRLEFGSNDVKKFIELMDTMNTPRAYQGADATNSIWTMSVFAPLRLLTDAQRAEFFKSYAKSGFEFSKDQFLQMYNTAPMLRESIEDILGRPLASVTREEVESMLKKEIKNFNPLARKDKKIIELITQLINGDLIKQTNNVEKLYARMGDPSKVSTKKVSEVESAELYEAQLISQLREAALTDIKDGKQIKIPMYNPILTTDVANKIGEFIDYDKYLYLMENRIHTPQDSYIDISTGFKPISKDSLVYDESTNAVSEEFYKTYPATLQASELRMRARAPMNFETFQKIKSTLPSYDGQVRSIDKPKDVSFSNKTKFLLQAAYDALRENPENLGMVTRLRASKVSPSRGIDNYIQDTQLDQKNFKTSFIPGYGTVTDENGLTRLTSVPNVLAFNSDPSKKNFGRTNKSIQNQMRQEFFAQKLLQNKNYFTEDEVRESIRLAQDNGKPMKVEVPENFFEKFNDSKVYDAAQLNLKELESDAAMLGLKFEEQDDITRSFLSNKQRAVEGINLDKEFKKDLMASQGLSQKGDGYLVERMLQRFKNNGRVVPATITKNLTAINSLMNKRQKQDFYKYHIFKYFDVAKDAEINTSLKSEMQKIYGTEKSVEDIRQQFVKDYETTNPQIIREYVQLMENLFVLSKEVFSNGDFGEPILDPIRFLYPSFVESDDPTKTSLKTTLINKTVSSIEMKSFDPSTLDFDPFKSIQIYANKIGKKMALDKLADGTKELGLTDNVKTVNLAREFAEREILSNPKHTKDILKAFGYLETELVNRFGYSFQRYQELYEANLEGIEPSERDVINARLDAIETLIDERLAATQDAVTNSAFAKSASSIDKNYETLDRLETEIRNPEFSQYVDGLKETLLLRDQFYGTLASIKTDTKFLDFLKSRLPNVRITDEYMRSLESDFFVKPYDNMSLEYLKTSLTNMNRPLFLRALEGRVYATNKSFADHLNKYFFTSKPSNKALDWMRQYSNLAVKLIMGNPLKLLERIEYFTATDLYMMTNANPFATTKMGRSRRELIGYQFAKPSEGVEEYSAVRGFLERAGNEARSGRTRDLFTRGDEIAPSKLDNPITDTTLDFIEIQNNFTRYALYLQTLEDLEKYGRIKYYGNAYVNKEGIDQLKTNEDKAWGVVASNIPLFGDLPFVLRYTSPWLVFASFPLAQARHLGEWVKSYHKVIKDDVIRNDPKEFMRNAAMPAGMLGLEMLLAQMIISAVADMYNVDEKTEEQWKKDDSFINIFQTLFFDKPTVRQGSANPYRIVYNNLIGTGIEAATDRRTGELRDDWLSNIPIGYFNKEIAGRLNPTLKVPLEIISEKDFFGTDFRSAPYDLNYMQNMLRKVSSYVVGSQGARALTDALVLHRYQPEEKSLLYSMIQGITNGVADEFGNSKTYKRDIKDFYAARSIVYGHLNGTEGSVYANDVQNFNDIINNEVRFNSNTNYSAEQVDEVSELLRAAMFREEDVSVVYNILLEKIDEGYSPSTLTAALNRVSVSRLIERIKDPDVFWESLSQKERAQLENGLAYERRIFPALNEVNLYSSSANNRSNFIRNIFIPFNEHRYMPYQNNQYNWYRPQRSNVYMYQNMNTFNPRYAANSAYERWVKRR